MKQDLHDINNILAKFRLLVKILAGGAWENLEDKRKLLEDGDRVLVEIEQFWDTLKRDLAIKDDQ